MHEVDYDEALALLFKAVETKGADYVYEPPGGGLDSYVQCAYFDNDGAPSCIVGHVLADLGVSREDIEGDNNTGVSVTAGSLHAHLAAKGIQIQPKAIDLLCRVQCKQDNSVPWGQAVAEAVAQFDQEGDE